MRVRSNVSLCVVGALWLMLVASMARETSAKPVVGVVLLGTLLAAAGCLALGTMRRRTAAATAVAVAVACALSAPVPLRWSDGCNHHTGWTFAAAAPAVLSTHPTDSAIVFGGTRTLMRCFAESAA